MKTKSIIAAALLCGSLSGYAQAKVRLSDTQLIVDNKPFYMRGGELGNSSAALESEIETIFPKLAAMNLNTVLVPAYWDLIEPEEGKFNFSQIDKVIECGVRNGLKVIFLWFGAWKNSMSCYTPLWVKSDVERFARSKGSNGRNLEILSPYSEANLQADLKAYLALLSHIAVVDKQNTVIMMQIENEIGMIPEARDHSQEAEKLFRSDVPSELLEHLKQNRTSLHPVMSAAWGENKYREKGNWEKVFGKSEGTDELFMAWSYAGYVEVLAREGKKVLDVPVYLNAALNSRGRKPGAYPSAGPLAHLIDIWRCGAPSVDLISPDIYDPGFAQWIAQYDLPGNPLFIPEIRLEPENGVRALYAFGEHQALGFSPFSIEDIDDTANHPVPQSYKLVRQIEPLLQARIPGRGVMMTLHDKEKILEFGTPEIPSSDFPQTIYDKEELTSNLKPDRKINFICRHDYTLGWDAQAKDSALWSKSGAIILQLSQSDFIVAGSGVVITFENADKNDPKTIGIGLIDEIKIMDGRIDSSKRLNGDQNHQGRHLRIPVNQWSIQRVKLYEY